MIKKERIKNKEKFLIFFFSSFLEGHKYYKLDENLTEAEKVGN